MVQHAIGNVVKRKSLLLVLVLIATVLVVTTLVCHPAPDLGFRMPGE